MNINLTLVAQAVSFAIFIWFTVKFVWPPMLRAIEQRQKQIADGLAAAEQGRTALERSNREAEGVISEARGRATDILAQAEKRGIQLIEEAKAAARAEADRERAAAKAELEQEISQARESLREQVAALAVAGAERILKREVDARVHAAMLSDLQKEL
ncbi:MAG: F0F1 ATP synthase subunit B [Betaproteobacteria bacterium]|jgi:F-type H+-transporting ATPase subunit b|nr:F0F1 ATP synthase subunit B [Rhodocyclaceae bacterium]MCA3133883.1 F0F1 ATP synthase subunit B [Rhodocyclaceae bacterium]MCA3143339.1 F0F1 ATP synthase subunit B [Rhodocyclaceae bacterium]MCA3147221.1 F0F1 ATP synthase subunit B [Rhodocyclaceae bacterium]MCE2898419.1 F0F1 ATP synthase subunit B [Betaproteobacteria bacterium]